MKVLSVKEAETKLAAVCEDVLAGQATLLKLANGALIQLTRVPNTPESPAISESELMDSYKDADWATFENHCAKGSD